jgi:hypothetical protein
LPLEANGTLPENDNAHASAYSGRIFAYAQLPLAYPATHAQEYPSTAMDRSDVDSVQAAPFTQGADAHSSMSMHSVPPAGA